MAENKQEKLKVSPADAQGCMLFAIGGFILFGSYKLLSLFVSKKIGEPLIITTKAIYKDQTLQGCLFELEKHMITIDKIGYIRFVHIIDTIVETHFNFKSDLKQVRVFLINNCIESYTQLKNVEVMRLFESFKLSKPTPSAAALADLTKLLNQILKEVYNHLQNIHTFL